MTFEYFRILDFCDGMPPITSYRARSTELWHILCCKLQPAEQQTVGLPVVWNNMTSCEVNWILRGCVVFHIPRGVFYQIAPTPSQSKRENVTCIQYLLIEWESQVTWDKERTWSLMMASLYRSLVSQWLSITTTMICQFIMTTVVEAKIPFNDI